MLTYDTAEFKLDICTCVTVESLERFANLLMSCTQADVKFDPTCEVCIILRAKFTCLRFVVACLATNKLSNIC